MSLALVTKISLLFILFYNDFLPSKKLRASGVNALKPKTEKLNECARCKLLTDSFEYWYEKTSRSHYQGIDSAWEVSKLRSYARSEVRFVDMQEGLCSELSNHQHDCYTLAEEAEQELEKYWFDELITTPFDLRTWLCIHTLKHCCPDDHFGEYCMPCPLDKDNKVCSGNGRCDGQGTREGNGLCICDRGYAGNLCEECAKNYYAYEGSCKECDQACDGCFGAGPAFCQSCRTGWKLDSGVCTDVDECAISICKSNQYCINKVGSYNCEACDESCESCSGAGPLNCTSCAPTSHLRNGECITESLLSKIIKNYVYIMTVCIGTLVILAILYHADRRMTFIVLIICTFYVIYAAYMYIFTAYMSIITIFQ